MITGRDLEIFEEQNRLTHPPYRNFNDWAEDINKNGGHCLCATDRMCPCPESLDEIRLATDPKRACCTCTLFCDNRYLVAWNHTGAKKPIEKVSIHPAKRGEIKNPEVKRIIETFEQAKKDISNDNAIGAYETLLNEGQEQHCEACQKFMMAEAHRALFLVHMVEADTGGYKAEKQRAVDKLNELIDLYYQVDVYDPNAPTPTPMSEGPGPTKNKKFRSPYHECASGVLNDPGVKEMYPDRKERFAYAVAQCGTKSRDGQ